MRKRISSKKFGRDRDHRNAMISNLACSLIEHKRIRTTHAKAVELRKFIEPMVTKSKNPTLHNRRTVLSKINNQKAVAELFSNIGPAFSERNGGYTRIIKIKSRVNDAAKMALIEFVDKSSLDVPVTDSSASDTSTEKTVVDN